MSCNHSRTAKLTWGVIKWWHPIRGHGFIKLAPDAEICSDVFVQASAIQNESDHKPEIGELVTVELDWARLKTAGPVAKSIWLQSVKPINALMFLRQGGCGSP